jgi:cytidine deaminase
MSLIQPSEIDRMIRRAIGARDQAYAPYSHFYVGAAILVGSGTEEEIFMGCNVENASYGLTICAERVAAGAAVAAGHRNWRAIAIASVGGVPPCGACRQFLAEFEPELPIYVVDVVDGTRNQTSLQTLFPNSFNAGLLNRADPSHLQRKNAW